MPQLLFDDFGGLPVGPLPVDFTATGEYHYAPPPGDLGQWYDPMCTFGPNAPWLVVEDEGRHILLHTLQETYRGPGVLVAGEDWTDVALTVRLTPLRFDGAAGVCFRYRTSRSHYRLVLDGGERLALLRVDHEEHTVLAECPLLSSRETPCDLTIGISGSHIRASVNGALLLEADDNTFPAGRIGLFANIPCMFHRVEATAAEAVVAAHVHARSTSERGLDALRDQMPKPVLHRQIDTHGFGAARQIRFGHLANRDRLDILLAQNIKLLPGCDDLATVRALTALDLDGNILWQHGEPGTALDDGLATCDAPVQIYDIDGDGHDEVLCLKNFKLLILDGRTGAVKAQRPLPLDPRAENHFGRVVGDAIVIANFRGLDRPRDIVVKNRYRQIWAFDDSLNLLWTHDFADTMTGHFAQPYDFDGDGRDELFIGYRLLGPDGSVRWQRPWGDHTDEIAIGPFDPARDDVQIALVCGEAGFNILAPDGTVLHRDFLGHAQRLTAARFREDLPGCQFYVVTYWGHGGIVSLHDCTGRKLFEFEPTSLGTVLNPVNWTGRPVELALLSGNARHGGMIDGHGRRVVVFPDDGHPDLCCEALNLVGDGRDEIVLWDMDRLWIYTQDRPFEGGSVYAPTRYPHHNASNYRAEISLP
ncbi:hypothetical protein HQ560_21175 [bacterium]|nr:hypothetical protein [bacterium]